MPIIDSINITPESKLWGYLVLVMYSASWRDSVDIVRLPKGTASNVVEKKKKENMWPLAQKASRAAKKINAILPEVSDQ